MGLFRKAIDVQTIDIEVDKYAGLRKWDELEVYLESLVSKKLTANAREACDYYYGIAAYQAGKRKEARERFKHAVDQHPQSGRIKFSYAQELLLSGDEHTAFEVFDVVTFPQVSSQHMLAACRYAYLWDRPEQGLHYLDGIFEAYNKLGITDDHFLYMRGLPFLGVTIGTAIACSWCLGQLDAASDMLAKLKIRLSDYDFTDDELTLDALKYGDASKLIHHLEQCLSSDKRFKAPDGHTRMRLAALKSSDEPDIDEAKRIIEEVAIGPTDFPWLDHVRILLKCQLASRVGNSVTENSLLSVFMSSQPLLFEPNHAVTYSLLPYQETLKPRARELAWHRAEDNEG